MRSRWFLALLAPVLLIGVVARDVDAQSFQGGLRGTAKDAGGVIPGVVVMLINEQTEVSRDTVSNASGEYAFPAVDPGTYKIMAVIAGYRTFERTGVRINTQQFLALDLKLEIGTIEETITVVGESPFIDNTNASTGSIIDSKALESIPTAGRSLFLLANLEPTVQASGNAHWNRMQDQVGNSAVSMGGGAVRANNYLVDGFPVTDLQNRASTNPSMEAVQEMKVQVHTYDAEMGRTGGGVINMTAKAGANDFHGSAYGVLRPESLVEQLLIPKLQNQPNVAEYWRDNGGGFGGPIVRNKTFFWSAGETYVDNQPQQNSFLVPTAAERNGDFSGLRRNGNAVVIRDPLTGQPFAGNIIPAGRINPVGQKIMNYMPTPDSEADSGSANFSMTDLLPNKAYQYSTKAEHHFNDSVALTGFWLSQVTHEANSNYNPVNRFVGPSFQLDRKIKTFVVNNQYVLGDSSVLTMRGGWNQFDDNYNLPYAFDARTLWPNNTTFINQMSDTNRFPSTTTTGYASTGFNPTHVEQALRVAQHENGRRLPHPGRRLVQLRRVDGHVHVHRDLQRQRDRRHAARLPAERQHPAEHAGERLRELLQRICAGRLAGERPPHVQLRPARRARDRIGGEEQPDHGQLRPDGRQPPEQPGERVRSADRPAAPGARRTRIRRRRRRADRAGPPAELQAGAARRRGLQHQRQDRAARRLRRVLVAVELSGGRYDRLGPDRLLGDDAAAAAAGRADDQPERSVPERPRQGDGQHARAVDGHRRRHLLRRSEQGCAARPAVLRRPAARAAGQREPERRLHRRARRESELGRFELRFDQRLHQHQPDRSEVSGSGDEHARARAESVLRRRRRGTVCDAPDDRARPAAAAVSAVRQRLHDAGDRRALDVSRRDRPAAEARRRTVGRADQLHVQPSERQPVRGEQLLFEQSRTAEQLRGGARLGLLQSGSGIRPQPARLAAQARGRADTQRAGRRRRARRLVGDDGRHRAERLPDRRYAESDDHAVPVRRDAASQRRARGRLPRGRQRHRSHQVERRRQPVPQQERVLGDAFQPVRQRAAHAARRALAVAEQRRPVGEQARQHRRRHVCAGANRSAEPVRHRPVGGAGEHGLRQCVVRTNPQPGEQHADDAVHFPFRVLGA
ncbi:MAG: hypothetical protein DMG03_12515 [Acidobacteria bacterium]|nr:MAG: hypothetical protein DMG03_12515 [Acidobacteriota bacterium]